MTTTLLETDTPTEPHRGSGRREEKIEWIALNMLLPHPSNEAIYGGNEDIADLLEGIISTQVVDPLTVYPQGSTYTILRGHRRREACKRLGIELLPCVVIQEELSEDEQLKILISGNFQREKTLLQKVKEGEVWEKIFKNEPPTDSPVGKTRDRVAEKISVGSGVNYEKAKAVVAAINENHPRAEELTVLLTSPKAKVDRAYKIAKGLDEPDPQQPKSVKTKVRRKQKQLGLAQQESGGLLPDVGRNEGDPYDLGLPRETTQQLTVVQLETIKNELLGGLDLGKNNRRFSENAISLFIQELERRGLCCQ